jgi:hypothetical protein
MNDEAEIGWHRDQLVDRRAEQRQRNPSPCSLSTTATGRADACTAPHPSACTPAPGWCREHGSDDGGGAG